MLGHENYRMCGIQLSDRVSQTGLYPLNQTDNEEEITIYNHVMAQCIDVLKLLLGNVKQTIPNSSQKSTMQNIRRSIPQSIKWYSLLIAPRERHKFPSSCPLKPKSSSFAASRSLWSLEVLRIVFWIIFWNIYELLVLTLEWRNGLTEIIGCLC